MQVGQTCFFPSSFKSSSLSPFEDPEDECEEATGAGSRANVYREYAGAEYCCSCGGREARRGAVSCGGRGMCSGNKAWMLGSMSGALYREQGKVEAIVRVVTGNESGGLIYKLTGIRLRIGNGEAENVK